mmetsp:Transcript_18437/g.18256  ORF Transcript_18437/g.18256 Transcript_18437/m.18256 type:complete len:92 (+) Transcript_18437:112-387(+)
MTVSDSTTAPERFCEIAVTLLLIAQFSAEVGNDLNNFIDLSPSKTGPRGGIWSMAPMKCWGGNGSTSAELPPLKVRAKGMEGRQENSSLFS